MAKRKPVLPSVEWVMPYGEGVDLEIYVGIRGDDFDEWITRMPAAKDMREMMQTLLVFIVCTASKQEQS